MKHYMTVRIDDESYEKMLDLMFATRSRSLAALLRSLINEKLNELDIEDEEEVLNDD